MQDEKDSESEIQQDPLYNVKIHHTKQTICQGTEQSARAQGQGRDWELKGILYIHVNIYVCIFVCNINIYYMPIILLSLN